jgi:hypothetical protein
VATPGGADIEDLALDDNVAYDIDSTGRVSHPEKQQCHRTEACSLASHANDDDDINATTTRQPQAIPLVPDAMAHMSAAALAKLSMPASMAYFAHQNSETAKTVSQHLHVRAMAREDRKRKAAELTADADAKVKVAQADVQRIAGLGTYVQTLVAAGLSGSQIVESVKAASLLTQSYSDVTRNPQDF